MQAGKSNAAALSTEPQTLELLTGAFRKFTETSAKLEEKHGVLLAEIESLKAELRAKDQEIKRTERLALLGETAGALAHEVRNPLGAVKLFISLLRRDLSDRPQSLEAIDQIDKSITSLDHVVSNILYFSKERRIAMAPVNIHSLIREQALPAQLGISTEAPITISVEGSPFIQGNEHGLRQVFRNLFLNALQATKFKGKIEVSATSSDGATRIVVRDDGPGIPEGVIGKIFDPFVTTKNEGTGLGLAIVRQIVTGHGGTITARNNGGAEFTITLPQHRVG